MIHRLRVEKEWRNIVIDVYILHGLRKWKAFVIIVIEMQKIKWMNLSLWLMSEIRCRRR